MAVGYARSRPAVHPWVMQEIWSAIGATSPVRRALDIGCGAGISTQALAGFALHTLGIEPNEAMLAWGRLTAPGAAFAAGSAEALPVRSGSVDLITAAGSLNYVRLEPFFAEVARVLSPEGRLAVYDFSPARSFRDGRGLDDWFAAFIEKYPRPLSEARELNPVILAGLDSRFSIEISRSFEIGMELTREFYLDYMMTETNVAAAVRRGIERNAIRRWCADTLDGVWQKGAREVLFRGYFVCMQPAE